MVVGEYRTFIQFVVSEYFAYRFCSICDYCSMYSRYYAIGKYTTTVSEQRLGKHVPAETNMHVTIDLLWKGGVFYVVRAEMI
jgi:hypothetical protein